MLLSTYCVDTVAAEMETGHSAPRLPDYRWLCRYLIAKKQLAESAS